MKRIRNGLFAVLLTLVGLTTLTACNTVEGIGEDIEAGGRAVSGGAEAANPSK